MSCDCGHKNWARSPTVAITYTSNSCKRKEEGRKEMQYVELFFYLLLKLQQDDTKVPHSSNNCNLFNYTPYCTKARRSKHPCVLHHLLSQEKTLQESFQRGKVCPHTGSTVISSFLCQGSGYGHVFAIQFWNIIITILF